MHKDQCQFHRNEFKINFRSAQPCLTLIPGITVVVMPFPLILYTSQMQNTSERTKETVHFLT